MLPDRDVLLVALEAARLGTVLLLLIAFSFVFYRQVTTDNTHGPITQVVVKVVKPRYAAILALGTIVAATYFADGVVLIGTAVLKHVWESYTPQWHRLEYADVTGLTAFALVLAIGSFKESKDIAVWTRRGVKFFVIIAILIDSAQLALIALTASFTPPTAHDEPHIPEQPPQQDLHLPNILHFTTVATRLLFLISLFVVLVAPRVSYVNTNEPQTAEDTHAQSAFLLPPSSSRTHYGTFSQQYSPSGTVTPAPSEQGPPQNGTRKVQTKPTPKKEIDPDPSWAEMWRRLKRVLPHLWPWRSFKLQSLAFICMILVLIGRFVNVGIPFSLGRVVENLDGWRAGGPSPWPPLLLYVGLRWGASALGTLEEMLWQPIMQYSDREMAQLSFDHILNLSLSYHTHRKTGEVLRVLDRGSAINHVFELVLFSIVPTFLDIAVGLVVFYVHFEPILSLVIGAVFVAYISASISLTATRTRLRRRMNDADVATRGIHTDCLLNYETVKYFGNERHEQQRYREAVLKYQTLEYKVIAYLNILNIVQNTIISIGLLVGSAIVALRIVRNQQNGTSFIIFVTYLAQLYGPLTQLGYIYRQLNQSLVDTEKLLKLLDEPVDIQDKPGAQDLVITNGEIEFENVSFSYGGGSHALRGVSFKIGKGQSVALVGQTGSGKSTALRLLYRFYDLGEGQGRILIDGQDIRNVTQASLRKAIGVVPQDAVLFNSTIEYNIRYGKLDADFDEVEAATRAAQMHDRILSFQDGYQTTVGERGVRLSGGEKQRVAIARTLLKNPPVLLLDEATSALDTNTERDIQNALQNLMHGRSSLSIAHRLSTISAADVILVLKDGEIIESGNIRELLTQNGEFASMWAEQVKADEDAQYYATITDDKQEPAGPASIKPSGASVKASAASVRSTGREGGYILDEPTPVEAAALEAISPSEAVEPETERASLRESRKDVMIDDAVRAESPLPEFQDRAARWSDAAPEGGYDASAPAEEPAATKAPSVKGEDVPSETVSFPAPAADEPAPLTASPQEIDSAPASGTAPVSFPAPDDASIRREGSIAGSVRPGGHGPAISFGPEVERHPSRTATPEGGEELAQKRLRTVSQNLTNLSKFAKRMSLGRRTSSMASGTPPTGDSPGPSTPPRTSGDYLGAVASPSPSASTEDVTHGSPSHGSPTPGGTLRGLLKRKDTMKEDKPPARRRTTLSFSRPKQPRPEQLPSTSPKADDASQS